MHHPPATPPACREASAPQYEQLCEPAANQPEQGRICAAQKNTQTALLFTVHQGHGNQYPSENEIFCLESRRAGEYNRRHITINPRITSDSATKSQGKKLFLDEHSPTLAGTPTLPPTSSHGNPSVTKTTKDTYDVIIVGGGTGRSVCCPLPQRTFLVADSC
jgi:hypothetical protein